MREPPQRRHVASVLPIGSRMLVDELPRVVERLARQQDLPAARQRHDARRDVRGQADDVLASRPCP